MLNKKYLKTKCKVEFSLPADSIGSAYLVGDFNDWNEADLPLEKKGKAYKVTVDLDLNKEYQFRYLVNGQQWQNDPQADGYTSNPYNGDNSLVLTYPAE
jgi:1,4-alpha-glucan branching enzyme